MKQIRLLILFILSFFTCSLNLLAQTLPENMVYSEQTHILSTGGQVLSDFYNEDSLKAIYLYFSQEDYWEMLHDATDSSSYVMADLSYDGERQDSVGVRFKGNTSYSKIKDTSEKLSFAISLDNYIDGQDVEGYNTLNLNNAYMDYTFMREVFYLRQNRQNIPAAQGNFVNLYINDEYWGIYSNIQQLNKDYTKEWFMTNDGSLWRATSDSTTSSRRSLPLVAAGAQWGDGTSALNYLGEDTSLYLDYYTLKSSEQENAWELLLRMTDVLTNTSDSELVDSLSLCLDIDRTLWFLAHEIAFSDDDSYIYKGKQDYYVYYEPETERFVPLEFDGNSVLNSKNTSWSIFTNVSDENYPLLNRLLGNSELRQRYLAHLRTIVDELFDKEATDSILDAYYDLITDDLMLDTKKLFTNDEYEEAFVALKQVIADRREFILNRYAMSVVPLTISDVTMFVDGEEYANPMADDSVCVTAEVSGDLGVSAVYLYYASYNPQNILCTNLNHFVHFFRKTSDC